MTAHQDSRVEAALAKGVDQLLDLVQVHLPEPGPTLLAAVRDGLAADARSALLELLAALGVDTSAHVRAPAVEVHLHDTEARPRGPLSFE